MTIIEPSPLAAYLRRLLRHSVLSEEEQGVILALPARAMEAPTRRDLVRPGEVVDHALLAADGLLGRFDQMRNGARQITALYIAGDMCDLHSVVAPRTGWGIAALAASTVACVPHRALKAAAARYPNLASAFWRDTTLDASILAKWIANMGRKGARGRIGHLFCEMGVRSEQAGIGDRRDYPLDLTQEQLGDVTGLTGVHVNRSLQALRDEGLIAVRGRRVKIRDWEALTADAGFDPAFLLCGERELADA